MQIVDLTKQLSEFLDNTSTTSSKTFDTTTTLSNNNSIPYLKIKGKYVKKNINYKQAKHSKEEIIKVLEETGKRIDFINPGEINDRLIELYKQYKQVKLQLERLKNTNNTDSQTYQDLRKKRQDIIRRFINLSSLIIGAVIKSINSRYNVKELYNQAILYVIETLDKQDWEEQNSKLTSWIYEYLYWKLKSEIEQEREWDERHIHLFND